MDIPETGVMRVLYNQHGAALWHYACRLTSNATRAEDVVQETLLRAGQHPQMVDGNERSARAWLFTVARDMISSNGSGTPEAGGLTSRELLNTLRGLVGLDVVGADIVEVAPAYDHAEITGIAAANLAYELVSLFALGAA